MKLNMNIKNRVVRLVKSVLPFYLFTLLPLTAQAQDDLGVRRGGCLSDLKEQADGTHRAAAQQRLAASQKQWDANRTYKQLVLLVTFSDTEFSMEAPLEFYNKVFNEQGFNQRQGAGCVADYFRTQSEGLFNLDFDVFGPYQVSSKAQPYANPTDKTKNYGKDALIEATRKFLEANPDQDLKQYDWNNDGTIDQVVYIYAGFTGNQSSTTSYGHIWPSTGTFSTVTTTSGMKISKYSSSAEMWVNKALCGIGTICHEYSHSLGLPDIYPTNSNAWTYSVVDEWDLMDGGNFTNFGWCPPNYTALEKYLMGWMSYTELKEPVTVEGMKPVSEGGPAYVVKHTDNEYLLLENRQWTGWDAGLPAKGLVIYHVNYVSSKWSANTPNNTDNAPNFSLVDPDGRSFSDWTSYLETMGVKSQSATYRNPNRMNRYYFSESVYPHNTLDSLTDSSVPAAKMYNENAQQSKFLSKPITNISMADDGSISFDFMGGGTSTGIVSRNPAVMAPAVCYDLKGQPVSGQHRGLLIVRQADGTVKKVFK